MQILFFSFRSILALTDEGSLNKLRLYFQLGLIVLRILKIFKTMAYTFSWLCWMSSWMILCFWGVSTVDFNLTTSSPATNSSAPLGLRGYRRYFANDSLIGRPVPCTHEDKICFRHNLVFSPRFNTCVALKHTEVNRTDFERGSRRFVSADLKYTDPCAGNRMAYDDVCYEREIVHDVICGRDSNITRHPFGGAECREAPASPISTQQPTEDGACVIPDFRFPGTERRGLYYKPLTSIKQFRYKDRFECGSEQAACFSQEKVYVAGYHGCHTLLQRGPCAEDHVVALDFQAAAQGRAEGKCVDVQRGCPKGYIRIGFDDECHEERQIKLKGFEMIILNQFGKYVVGDIGYVRFFPTLNENFCVIHPSCCDEEILVGSPVVSPYCGANDRGVCKYEVVNEPPKPMP